MPDFLYSGPVPGAPGWWPPVSYPWGGGGRGPVAHFFSERREVPVPNPWRTDRTPDPIPWSVTFLVSAVSSKVAAANMTNPAVAQQMMAAADQAITAFIDSDDICPRWPYPGPPPWLSIIASELTLVAHTFQDGALRTGVLQVAGQILDRVALNPQPLPP